MNNKIIIIKKENNREMLNNSLHMYAMHVVIKMDRNSYILQMGE
jgi:hypothetical protein